MRTPSVAYYTRFVQRAKWLLGSLAVILVCLILLYPTIKRDTEVRVAFTSVEKTTKPTPTEMIKANFHGFDDNNQPFNVTADTVLQRDENLVEFTAINSDITLNGGVWLFLRAQKGSMQVKEHMLFLKEGVELLDDNGYTLQTGHITVDISKKTAITDDVVHGYGPLGKLKSHGAIFYGTAKSVMFSGPVFVTLTLPPKESNP